MEHTCNLTSDTVVVDKSLFTQKVCSQRKGVERLFVVTALSDRASVLYRALQMKYLWTTLVVAAALTIDATDAKAISLVCSESNDLCQLLLRNGQGLTASVWRYDNLTEALAAGPKPGDGLMIMADAMRDSEKVPQNDTTIEVSVGEWQQINQLGLRTYVEFPASIPAGLDVAPTPLRTMQTLWERIVVTQNLSESLPLMALLTPHKHVDFVNLPEEWCVTI